ncbi:transposase [Escherichia coli O157:H7]|uniref:IS66-like element accessory protein TnpA n=2 Tax=Escherichia coli TaxID=562 RepID=UPI0019D2CE77|nr:transposase [Escherichia coli O157:H7]
MFILTFQNHTNRPLTDFGGKTSIFSHPVYLFLREFSLQDFRGGSPEFKQQLVAASCEPGISISKLALENGINANLLFKWRQQWREGKLLLPSSESPQLLPVTLDAAAEQPESLAEDPETLSISCEVTFRHGTLRFNGNVSEKLLTLLIQELKR